MKQYISILVILLLFASCSSRRYYEPKHITNYLNYDDFIVSHIKSKIDNIVRLQDNELIIDDKLYDFNITDDEIILNQTKRYFLLADIKNNLILLDKKNSKKKIYNLKTPILSATKKDNLIASLHYDNSISLYDINKKQILLKEYQSKSYTIDTKVANPYFMDNIIVYPTINGNIVIVSLDNKSVVKTIAIDTEERFVNIRFLDVIDDILVVATPHKLVSISSFGITKKDYELRQIIKKDKYIYIATLDGQILKLNSNLEVINKTKLKFGRINAIGFGKKYFFAYEHEGYLVKFDNKLNVIDIYERPKSDDDKVFIVNKKLYIGNRYLDLTKLEREDAKR